MVRPKHGVADGFEKFLSQYKVKKVFEMIKAMSEGLSVGRSISINAFYQIRAPLSQDFAGEFLVELSQ